MTIRQLTTYQTEADLEAAIHGALQLAFPWLDRAAFRHQTKFSFKFGREEIEVDGAKVSASQARADIIIWHRDRALAVLELKRKGVKLTSADEAQGLSYARMLHPRPPLVVVTNGSEVRKLETQTGKAWQPSDENEAELEKLIASVARAAANDLKNAVEVLLGRGSEVWVSVVRRLTQRVIQDMCGRWDEPLKPFLENFLIPRKATGEVLREIRSRRRIVIVSGPPLVGKTSVLRDVAVQAQASDDLAVLFVEADSSREGILQILSNELSNELGWTVTLDDVRRWLRGIARSSPGPALVIVVDAPDATDGQNRSDLDELLSNTYGKELSLVVSLDDTLISKLTLNSTGRKATRIGRLAKIVEVELLDDAELKVASKLLRESSMVFMPGYTSSPELRVPWILRAIGAGLISSKPESGDLLGALPPLLGLRLFSYVRERFSEVEIRKQFRELARAVLVEYEDSSRDVTLTLHALEAFVVRQKTLAEYIDQTDLDKMIGNGLLKETLGESGEVVAVPRLPELLAEEIASVVGEELAKKIRKDPVGVSGWLIGKISKLPLGDIIGAQAVLDAGDQLGVMPTSFFVELLNQPPRHEKIQPGQCALMRVPTGQIVELKFETNQAIMASSEGRIPAQIEVDSDESLGEVYSDMEGWLILSHLAAAPIAAMSKTGEIVGRFDPTLLLTIGSCPIPLRRPNPDSIGQGFATHDFPDRFSIVCHESGIVESITFSLFEFLRRDAELAPQFVEEAISSESYPLLIRLDIALGELSHMSSNSTAWAARVRDELIRPALLRCSPFADSKIH
jgi:hypothetical protein